MRNFWMILGLTVALGGCAGKATLDIPTGSDVTLEKTDGVTVAGRLVEVKAEQVVVESRDGVKTSVPRAKIASMHLTSTPVAADATPAANVDRPTATTGMADRKPKYRELTVPAGTTLTVALTSMVGSDTSHVEDHVGGTLRRAVRIGGIQALPIGTAVSGHVTSARPAGKVKGRGSIAFRFNTIDLPGDSAREKISTATYSRVSRATKQKDATKIGVGAGAGAVIGGILGGGDGAAKGAAIGGGAGTAVVLSTKGDESRIPAGTLVTIRLTAPLKVRVLVK